MSEVIVLVDFDNVDGSEISLGVEHVTRKVLRLCDRHLDASVRRARIRLYGGWYENGRMTRSAQMLIQQISMLGVVVRCRRWSGSEMLATVELANSLLADPATLVDNTFRRRQLQRNLRCKDLPWTACFDPANCASAIMYAFAGSGCSKPGCSVLIADVFERNEQKVVDSMLVADLIEASLSGFSVALVSRDDDMWPGLRMAVQRNANLVHLLTKPGAQLPSYYSALHGAAYQRINWS